MYWGLWGEEEEKKKDWPQMLAHGQSLNKKKQIYSTLRKNVKIAWISDLITAVEE